MSEKIKRIERLNRIFKHWLYIEDDNLIETAIAVRVAIDLPGDPLWFFLIAPPGGTKTEILRAFGDEKVYTVSSLTAHSLISGLPPRKGHKQVDLMPQLDGKLLVIKDFTSILSIDDRDRGEIFSQLRDAYDGYSEKAFGSGVGKKSYYATFGLLAGVTPVIDMYRTIHQLLGERFLHFRIRGNEEQTVKRASSMAGGEEEMRLTLKEAVDAFLSQVSIDLSIKLPTKTRKKLVDLAILTAQLRSTVARDRNRIVLYKPQAEIGTRLVKQFIKLGQALAIVCEEKTINKLIYSKIKRVALDTIPTSRTTLLLAMLELEDWATTKTIGDKATMATTTAKEFLEDIWMLGIIKRKGEASYEWRIPKKTRARIENSEILETTIGLGNKSFEEIEKIFKAKNA